MYPILNRLNVSNHNHVGADAIRPYMIVVADC